MSQKNVSANDISFRSNSGIMFRVPVTVNVILEPVESLGKF